jgi:hypothetical protein
VPGTSALQSAGGGEHPNAGNGVIVGLTVSITNEAAQRAFGMMIDRVRLIDEADEQLALEGLFNGHREFEAAARLGIDDFTSHRFFLDEAQALAHAMGTEVQNALERAVRLIANLTCL